MTARFDHIGGLTVKAPVTLAGVAIGGVASDRLDLIRTVEEEGR